MDHPHPRGRRAGAVVALLVAVLVLAGCVGSSSKPLVAAPTSTTSTTVVNPADELAALAPPPGFRIPDSRGASITPVQGRALPSSIPIRGGNATVTGAVNGPDGSVAGASVLIERFVGTDSASLMLSTDGSGRYAVAGLLGGRYRVRAWLAPLYTSVQSATNFVADGDRLEADIAVERHDATSLQLVPSVGAVLVGNRAAVTAQVSHEVVDGNGVVQAVASGGVELTLAGPDGVVVEAPNPVTTDDWRAGLVDAHLHQPGLVLGVGHGAVAVRSGRPPVLHAAAAAHDRTAADHLDVHHHRRRGRVSTAERRPPPPGAGRPAERRPVPRRALRTGLRIAVILVVGIPMLVAAAAGSGFGTLLYGNLPGTVPEQHEREVSSPSYVYDADGNQIATFRKFDLNIPMTEQDVPEVLKQAVVAAEDRKFWTHKGVDPEGLVRAAITNYREGATVQGGSTITQQYVKNTYLSNERTVERKLNEAVLATRLERDLTDQLGSQHAAKEEILYRYLDTVYFGSGAYGAAAAAQSYFRTDIKDLSISQAAALAAIIPAPSKYGPRDNLFKAEERRVEVLGEMRDQGDISDSQYADAKAKFLWPTALPDPGTPTTAVYGPPDNGANQFPYFVDYVRQYITEKYDGYQGMSGNDLLYKGGLRIYTTIDPRMQALADTAVNQAVGTAEPTVQMALVSVDPTNGFVKAMVGGRDFTGSQVNFATGGSLGMQPGSSMKPYTMAAALEEGVTPDTVFPATSGWLQPTAQCQANPGEKGCVINGEPASTMGPAIAESSNTYFAQLSYEIGPDNVAKMANRLGVSTIDPTKHYPINITLGTSEVSPLDQAVGYATFDNHGVRQDPTPVVKVVKDDGTVLEDNTKRAGTQVLNPAIADTVTQLLKGPVQNGTASRALADFGRPAAGKTGTTDDSANAWFVGYTPQLVTAVWLGHADGNRALVGFGSGPVFGGTVPALTWKAFMQPALDGVDPLDFAIPGPLPPPGTGGTGDPNASDSGSGGSGGGSTPVIRPSVRRPVDRSIPDLASDCGGPCVQSTELPAPAPPSTPPSTLPATTTTTKAPSP